MYCVILPVRWQWRGDGWGGEDAGEISDQQPLVSWIQKSMVLYSWVLQLNTEPENKAICTVLFTANKLKHSKSSLTEVAGVVATETWVIILASDLVLLLFK